MKFSAWYSILVGVLMFGQWAFFLTVGSVPEIQSEPIELVFHLAAEVITAFCLIVGGIALISRTAWARNLTTFSSGMLAYTIIVSSGYFAQLRQWPLVGMFAVLLILDLLSVSRLINDKGSASKPYPIGESSFRSPAAKLN